MGWNHQLDYQASRNGSISNHSNLIDAFVNAIGIFHNIHPIGSMEKGYIYTYMWLKLYGFHLGKINITLFRMDIRHL